MPKTDTDHFDAFDFIDGLIEEMGMQNEDPIKLQTLKQAMFEALTRHLLQAAQDNIEPEVVDFVLEELKDEPNPAVLVQTLIQTSPMAQIAMLAALEEFRANTLEAYNYLKV